MQSADLLRHVRVDELHEHGQLPSVGGRQQKMRVCRQEYEGMNGHPVERLGLANDAEDKVGELGRWPEQQPAVQGTRGDFDHGVFGHEAERAWHTELSASYGRSCFTRGLARRLHLFQVTGTRPALAARSGARVLYSTVKSLSGQVPLRWCSFAQLSFRLCEISCRTRPRWGLPVPHRDPACS